VAGVSRRWRGRYIKLCYTAAQPNAEKLWTSYKCAIMTAERTQLAFDNGLTIAELEQSSSLALNLAVESLEAIDVLTLLKLYDLKWCTKLTAAAAETANWELLQWLHKYGCPWLHDEVADCAAWSDDADTLIWLHKVAGAVQQETLNKCMQHAGCADNLSGVKWLWKEGARWPDSFACEDEITTSCWSAAAAQFALQNGAHWATWRCQDIAPANYICTGLKRSDGDTHNDAACTKSFCSKRNAVQLFKWAHENGCPCTCDADAAAAAAAAV
jgi:hypothetical protein